MHTPDRLPTPDPDALAHSNELKQRIATAIEQSSGRLPFQAFMHMALYEPGLGYYVAGKQKLGAAGDFITAPELSPLFSQCIANQYLHIRQQGKLANILELGAGSGRMAADSLLYLETQDKLPERYLILEVSPDLQQQQYRTLQQSAPHLLDRVEWLSALPETFNGLVLANEVLDAMPVEWFCVADNTLSSLSVELTNDQFQLCKQAADPPTQAAIHHACLQTWDQHYNGFRPETDYCSEYNPALAGWVNALSKMLDSGAILLIDYGYERADYYRPERQQGTLICHYQHRVHDDPLLWPGLQDITASVDFTAVAEAADTAGMQVAGYTTQGHFLLNSGLASLFENALQHAPNEQYHLAQQVRTLMLPSEMGERFKVMALTKKFASSSDTATLAGFENADQRHRL